MLRRRLGLAGRLRPELHAYRFPDLDAGREREAIAIDDAVALLAEQLDLLGQIVEPVRGADRLPVLARKFSPWR